MKAVRRTMNFSLVISLIVCSCLSSVSGVSPPSLTEEPPAVVWFKTADGLRIQHAHFELPCSASGHPETFKWKKNGEDFAVDGTHVNWMQSGKSGAIQFRNPVREDEGFYQCFVSNAFGTAVSNRVEVKMGSLQYFPEKKMEMLTVLEGRAVSIPCTPPRGNPPPAVNWVVRDNAVSSVMESLSESQQRRAAIDENGTLHFSYVLAEDSQTSRYFECSASSPVLRGEYHGGDRYQLRVKKQSYIHPIDAYVIYRSPEYVNVRAGETLKLSCIVGGYPNPEPHWSKIDGAFPSNERLRLEDKRFFIVENVHPSDEGTYECKAASSDPVYFQVSVEAAPFWEYGRPEDVSQNEDETAELRCYAMGEPRPLIRWFMNGIPLHELRDNNTRRLTLDDGRLLRIQNAIHDVDTGVYQCNASNPLGYVFANAFINVLAIAPRFRMVEKSIFNGARGSTVDFPCDVEAAPRPVVRWVDANDQPISMIDAKVQLLPNHTLRIYNVDHADEGVYYCNVSNKYGINRAEYNLTVFDPTYFKSVPSPSQLVVNAKTQVELHCEAASDSRLTVEYIWTRNGKTFDFVPMRETNMSILRLENVRGRDSGRIECIARTAIGEKSSGMELIVTDVPEAPVNISVECHPMAALISWKPPLSHGSSISKYTVELQTGFEPQKWQMALVENNTKQDEFTAHIGLSPWVNYTFRVTAYNGFGAGVAGSARNAHCETEPNVPFINPAGVRVAGTEPHNLVIHWKPLGKMDWNGPNLIYLIRYRLRGVGEKWQQFFIEDPLADHTILREKPTFREYEVQVRAVNAKGLSNRVPETVVGYSGEDVPTEAPAKLTLATNGERSFDRATVRWSAVHPDTFRGHFRGYKVEYWDAENPYFVEEVRVGPESLSAQLKNLKALRNYTVVVKAVNEGYESSPSLSITFSTPEGPPSAVANLKVTPVGAQSMLATWDPPFEPNGNIRGYYVQFENSSSPLQIKETYVTHNQLYYLSEQLEPDSVYVFHVWAETFGGEGPKATRQFRTFPMRDPDPPSFAMISRKKQAYLVKWNISAHQMPGTTFHVKYAVKGTDEWNSTEEIALPNREFTIDNLLPDKDYWVIGVARENERETESKLFKLHTDNGSHFPYINMDNLREAAWFIAILVVVAVILLLLMLCCCCTRRKGQYDVQRRELRYLKPEHHDADEECRKLCEYGVSTSTSKHDDDPPTVTVSLPADSSIELDKRYLRDLFAEDERSTIQHNRGKSLSSSDSPPQHHHETAHLLPNDKH